MFTQSIDKTAVQRITLALIGGLAGFCLWFMVDEMGDFIDNPQALLFIISLTGAFFAVLFATVGPLKVKRAAITALMVALPAALLLLWASNRFESVSDFMSHGAAPLAFLTLITLPLPFLITRREGAAAGVASMWDYPALFGHAWGIVVRYGAAWVFVAVFWGILMISGALLNVVGLDIIEWVLKIDPVAAVLTGAAFGVAIAVVNEMSDFLSPYLILRLFRLFLPVVLVVVVVFIAALPFRGLSDLFGSLSATGVLLAVAAGVATLITAALDQDDAHGVHTRYMRLFARALALLLPILTGLAAYAVFLRVVQYGWTPNRIGAMLLAVIGLGYGILYALAALRKSDWMHRIRQANIIKAMVMVVAAVLTLTPVLNPQRISTNSQIARLQSGAVTADQMGLWKMANDWGVAGKAGIARLQAQGDIAGRDVLEKHLAMIAQFDSYFGYSRQLDAHTNAVVIDRLLSLITLHPADGGDARQVLNHLPSYHYEEIEEACLRKTASGNPACVLLFVDLLAGTDKPQALLFFAQSPEHSVLIAMRAVKGAYETTNLTTLTGSETYYTYDETVIDAVLEGAFSIKPADMNALHLKDRVLIISP